MIDYHEPHPDTARKLENARYDVSLARENLRVARVVYLEAQRRVKVAQMRLNRAIDKYESETR